MSASRTTTCGVATKRTRSRLTRPRGAPRLVPACDSHATILGPALPDREVVGERDAPRVELLQPRDPRRVCRVWQAIAVEAPREERARVVGRLVEGLAGDHD